MNILRNKELVQKILFITALHVINVTVTKVLNSRFVWAPLHGIDIHSKNKGIILVTKYKVSYSYSSLKNGINASITMSDFSLSYFCFPRLVSLCLTLMAHSSGFPRMLVIL